MSDIENGEGDIVEAARTLLGLGPDNDDVDTLDRVRELRRKSAGYDALVRTIAALAKNASLAASTITAAETAGCPIEVVAHLRDINYTVLCRSQKGQSRLAPGSKIEPIFARLMPTILEEQTKANMAGVARIDTDDRPRTLAFEADGLLKSLESAEVGGWTLPDPSDTRAGSHTIVKVDDGHLSVIQAGQHRSWILKARELAALTAKAEQASKAPTAAAILNALRYGIDHAPDAHWIAEPCGHIVSTAVGMMLRVPGLEQQNRELHQALAKRKATITRWKEASGVDTPEELTAGLASYAAYRSQKSSDASAEIERLRALLSEPDTLPARLAHARDAANKLYQTATDARSTIESAARFLHSSGQNTDNLYALLRALDPVEIEASAKEATRRDGLEAEIEAAKRVIRDRGLEIERLTEEDGVRQGDNERLTRTITASNADIDRLTATITQANNALFDVAPDIENAEHLIECHADKLSEAYRRLTKGAAAAWWILSATVLGMVDGAALCSDPDCGNLSGPGRAIRSARQPWRAGHVVLDPSEQAPYMPRTVNGGIPEMRPVVSGSAFERIASELARVLAHIATLPPWFAPTPPPGMRPAVLGGECARCLAQPGYHEGSCVRRMAPSVETFFAKWAPMLSPYLNGEQLANLRNDAALAVGACCARAETAERRLAELRSDIEALRARLQAVK